MSAAMMSGADITRAIRGPGEVESLTNKVSQNADELMVLGERLTKLRDRLYPPEPQPVAGADNNRGLALAPPPPGSFAYLHGELDRQQVAIRRLHEVVERLEAL